MDHIGLPVVDLAHAKAFFTACLTPLGWELRDYGERGTAFRKSGGVIFYLSPSEAPARGVHLAFAADSRSQVDAFHEAALAAGAIDHGRPGPRPHYADGYYAAFVLDGHGNNLEAVFLERVTPRQP